MPLEFAAEPGGLCRPLGVGRKRRGVRVSWRGLRSARPLVANTALAAAINILLAALGMVRRLSRAVAA